MIIINSIIGLCLFISNCLLLLGLKKFFQLAKKNNQVNNNKFNALKGGKK